MAKQGMSKFSRSGKIGLSFLIIAVVTLIAVGTTFALIPRFADVAKVEAPKVVAIIPTNNNEISTNADVKSVYVIVKYSDGSEKQVELSELVVSGLDTTKPGELENVELVYGGFKQNVKYKVVSTELVIKYSAPGGGGRIDGQKEQKVNAGMDASRVRAIPDEGYIFVRWDDGNPNPVRQERAVASNREYIATFEKKELIVAFQYPDGTLTREQRVPYGNTPQYVPSLEEESMKLYGYKFTHWSIDPRLPITEDSIIVANYEKYATNLHLDISSRDGDALAKIEEPDDFYEKALPYFQKGIIAKLRLKSSGGRVFTGWAIQDYQGNYIDLLVAAGEEPNLVKVEVRPGINIDFYCSSVGTKADEFLLTFTPPAGVDDIFVKANLIYEESQITFYSFGNMVKKPDGQQLQVRLNNNLSDVVGVLQRESFGQKFNYDNNKLHIKGHVFKGWEYTRYGVTHIIDETNFYDTYFDQDTELNAIWELGVYDVEFRKNDNEDPTFIDESKGYDVVKEARVLKVKFQSTLNNVLNNGVFPGPGIKEDYLFKGWYTNKATGPAAVSLNTVLDEEGLIVYPLFEVKKVKLNANITGSGKVYFKEKDQSGVWYNATQILSQFDIDVISSYKIGFEANENYYISSVKVNGEAQTIGVGATSFELDLVARKQNVTIDVVFTLFNSRIFLSNGSSPVIGSVEYINDIDYGEGHEYGIGDRVLITTQTAIIPAQTKSKKLLSIRAPENYGISRILIDGVELSGIPLGIANYSIEVNVNIADINMTIIYQAVQFHANVITPSDQLTNGAINIQDENISLGHSARFNMGYEEAYIYATAATGYYIKNIKVNGYILNPYANHSNLSTKYLGSEIYVNYELANLSKKDPRVSSIRYRVRTISENLAIDIEFGAMYYKVETSSIGTGNVTPTNNYTYASKVNVNGSTSDNNYVQEIDVNNSSIITTITKSTYTHTIDSIKGDYKIVFKFAPRNYGVSFTPDANLSIKYQDLDYSLINGKTFVDIQRNTNALFQLSTDEYYEISSIKYRKRASSDAWTSISIPYNTKEYQLKIDAISDSYEYQVETRKMQARLVLKAVGLDSVSMPSIEVNNEEISYDANNGYATAINHGTVLEILLKDVSPGYRVNRIIQGDLSTDPKIVAVKNSTDNSYQYSYKGPGQLAPSGGYFTITPNELKTAYMLSVHNLSSDIEVVLAFEKTGLQETSPYTITYKTYVGSGGTVTAEDKDGQSIANGGTIVASEGVDGNEYATVKYHIATEAGYAVKALVVNGIVHTFYNIDDAQDGIAREITTRAKGDQDVEVLFVKAKNKLTLINSADLKGDLSSNKVTFENNEDVTIKVTPNIGYEINRIVIRKGNGDFYPIEQTAITSDPTYQQTSVYEFNVRSDFLNGDLTIEAYFSAKRYSLQITQTGGVNGQMTLYESGTLKDVGQSDILYDERYQLNLEAPANSYIKNIYINGFEMDVSSLENISNNPNNIDRVLKGEYNFIVSGNLQIEVKFEYEEYYLRLVGSQNGKVTARVERTTGSTPYLSFEQHVLYATDSFSIMMIANIGYNVKRLLINGTLAWENTNPALILTNKQCINIAEVSNYTLLGSVINIEVVFEINSYSINIDSKNTSSNFKNIDINSSDYGQTSISGRAFNPSGIYRGFAHGSNVRIDIRPIVGRGYYISKLEIEYANQALGTQDYTNELTNPNGDSFLIRNISCNIVKVLVEYKRRTYELSFERSLIPDPSTAKYNFVGNTSGVRFYNPYDRELTVVSDGGSWEYGLGFESYLDPGTGYDRTLFVVNNVDRMNSIRANIFKGIINENIDIKAVFSIKKYKILLDYQIGEMGKLEILDPSGLNSVLWNEDLINNTNTYDIATGTVSLGYDTSEGKAYLVVTHNTRLSFKITPSFEERGYRIARILKGSRIVSFSNPEVVVTTTENIVDSYTFKIEFEKAKYEIIYSSLYGNTGLEATVLEPEVEWGNAATINMVIDKGYYLSMISYSRPNTDDVKLKEYISQESIGSSNIGSYVDYPVDHEGKQRITIHQSPIKSRLEFKIVVLRCRHDIFINGQYNATKTHNGEDYKAGLKIVTNEANPAYLSNIYSTEVPGTIINEGNTARVNRGTLSNYVGLRYNDQVKIVFNAPSGYDINTVVITMGNFGLESTIVYGPEDTSNIVRNSLYEYLVNIPFATGDISIDISYKIRRYKLNLLPAHHGVFTGNTTTTQIEHHSPFAVELLADYGYYLETFSINDNLISNLSIEKTDVENKYKYNTTRNEVPIFVIDDFTRKEALKDMDSCYEIKLFAKFTSLKFDVDIYVDENGQGVYKLADSSELTMLNVVMNTPDLVYDSNYAGLLFNHTLQEGSEITKIEFYNQNKHNPGTSIRDRYVLDKTQGNDISTIANFVSSSPSLATLELIGKRTFDVLDYHSTIKNKLYIYYAVSIKNFDISSAIYYVRNNPQGEPAGSIVEAVADDQSNILASYSYSSSDNLPLSSKHNYGTRITFATSVPSENVRKVEFTGFQELIDGEWKYLTASSGIITGTDNNQVLSLVVKGNRMFRAVYYQVFEIDVALMPSYRVQSGTPNYNNLTNMGEVKAFARYSKAEEAGVIVPYVKTATQDNNVYKEQELKTINTELRKTNFRFLVRAGAKLVLTSNEMDIDFCIVTTPKRTSQSQIINYSESKEEGFKQSNGGYKIRSANTVNAYFNAVNSVAFISRESLGLPESEASSGAEIKYRLNKTEEFRLLNSQYIRVPSNSYFELEITIKPNFRFESFEYRVPFDRPNADGKLEFGSYANVETGNDGERTTVVYVDRNDSALASAPVNPAGKREVKKINIKITNFAFHKVFKAKFIKQIRVFKYAQLMRDSITETLSMQSGSVGDIDSKLVGGIYQGQESDNDKIYFDFDDELEYKLRDNWSNQVTDIYGRPYQFVGYIVNNKNLTRDLAQRYPDPKASQKVILNDRDLSLDNGVSFAYETNKYSGNNLEYVVKVVAKFMPIYNILVENAYEDDGQYVDTGVISVTTTGYLEDNLNIENTSTFVYSQQGGGDDDYTNKLIKIPGKINSSLNAQDINYDVWKNNEVTLNWVSSSNYRQIAFIGWEFYGYNPDSQDSNKFKWVPLQYQGTSHGRITSSKDTIYSFPLSSLLPEMRVTMDGMTQTYRSYYYYTQSNGYIEGNVGSDINNSLFSYDNIATYNAEGDLIPGAFISKPVIRIRPRFERKVFVDVNAYLAATDQNNFEQVVSGTVLNPTIGNSGLNKQACSMNDVIMLNHNTIANDYSFDGWYYRPNPDSVASALIKLDNSITSVTYKGQVRQITYMYLHTEADVELAKERQLLHSSYGYEDVKDNLVLKLDWADGDYYIGTKYFKLYDVRVNVNNISGSSVSLLQNSRPELVYYGTTYDDITSENYENPISFGENYDRFSFTVKVRAGEKVLFKLNTKFEAGVTNSYNDNCFNPRYDEISNIQVFANNSNINTWLVGLDSDHLISSDIVIAGSNDARDVTKIEATKYAIRATAKKVVDISIKSYGMLHIHNLPTGAEIKLPRTLADELQISNGLIKDGGTLDKDATDGVIRIERIPISEHFDIKGKEMTDFGVKISPYLRGNKVIASENFEKDITLDGSDSSIRKEQHLVIYETKEVSIYNLTANTVEQVTVGEGLKKPFESGDGSEGSPFIIMTTYQFKQINSLYVGNENTLVYDNNYKFHFKLGADIDLADAYNPVDQMLCKQGSGFNGVLNGNAKALYNFSMNDISNTGIGVGIFRKIVDGAKIDNVKISTATQGISSFLGNAGFFAPIAESVAEGIIFSNITNYSDGLGYLRGGAVGGIVGIAIAQNTNNSIRITMSNISLTNANIRNITYDFAGKVTFDESGGNTRLNSFASNIGAGGIVGVARGNIYMNGVSSASIRVDAIAAQGARFAGGIAGIYDNPLAHVVTASNLYVENPNIEVRVNFAGGAIGVLGLSVSISGLEVKITEQSSQVVGSYLSSYRDPKESHITEAGIGGAIGINYGRLENFKYTGSGEYRLDGGIVGGVIGINEGVLTNSPLMLDSNNHVKLRTTLLKPEGEDRKSGGVYGGVVGWNRSTAIISELTIDSTSYANYTTPFAAGSAYYELAYDSKFTNYASTYQITGDTASPPEGNGDISNVYFSGVAGYNSSNINTSIQNIVFKTKIILQREGDAIQADPITNANIITQNNVYSDCTSTDSRLEVMRNIMADEPGAEDLNRPLMKDNIGSSGTSGAVYIRYFAQGSKYAAGTTALTGAKRVHSSQYRISRVALRTVSAAVVDVACTTEIKPTSASFAITYNGVNLAEGKVVKAGGGGAFSAFNYEGFVRQTEVVRTNI